ncbi:retrovirus-related pol polyprotein from transposon TNT 1-94 [Tanacetum coccineum]
MHNNIMAAGLRDRPPMLATGRYAQWRSRFLRYIDTRPNGDALRKCILKGPYTPTIVTTPVVPATENSPAVPEQTTVETVMNMTPENRAHFESEKESLGNGGSLRKATNKVFSLNIQDVKDKLILGVWSIHLHDGEHKCGQSDWKFGKFTRGRNVAGARETVGGQVVQQSGIQCFNCKEFGHYAKECRKPKRVKDSTYHKEKMLLYTAEEIDETRIKAIKEANATLTQELTECKSILAETSRTLGESNSIQDSCLVALQNKQTEFERYKAFNDRTVDYDKLEEVN